MRLLLIRHAEQASKVCNADVSLSETGKKQAEALAVKLTGTEIEAIYSSPLLRALQTAEIISSKTNAPVLVRDSLQEMDFGELTGLSHEDRIRKEKLLSAGRNGSLTDRPYPGGESYGEVYARAYPVLEEIITAGYGCVCVVSHLEALRAVLSGMIGLPFDHAKQILKGFRHTGIADIGYDEEKKLFFLRSVSGPDTV